jgi:hypothetical protein
MPRKTALKNRPAADAALAKYAATVVRFSMKIEKDIILSDGKVTLRYCRPDDAQEHCNAVHESIGELAKWMPWLTQITLLTIAVPG